MKPAPCRGCGTAVLRVKETDTRVALAAVVDAEPLSALLGLERAPPEAMVWEHHPQRGWVCLDLPRRHGWPIHLQHKCTSTSQKEVRP